MKTRFMTVVAVSAALAFGVAACGDPDTSSTSSSGGDSTESSSIPTDLSGDLAGAGASSQEAAQEAWIAGLQGASPDVTVSYDPIGSGGGREQFIAGAVDYAGSDSALADEELQGAIDNCSDGDLVQIPVYISPIAIIYNLEDVDSLQLDPDTLASIFAQEITTWNDPAIAKLNPDVDLPDERITPVNRSDESGTTENFTDYLSQTAPDVWTFPVDGNWPVKGGEAANGTSGVVDAVKNGSGTIGYADASQAGDLGVASIQIGDEFVQPSAEGAAATVDESKESNDGGEYVFSYEINRTTDNPDAYPVILVSYEIGCTAYSDADTAPLVNGLFSYIISPEGQDAAASNAGSAPISEQLRSDITPAVEAIGG